MFEKREDKFKYSGKKDRENFSLVNLHNRQFLKCQDSFTSSFDELDRDQIKSGQKSPDEGEMNESFLRFSQACKNFYEDNLTTMPSSNHNAPNLDHLQRITPLKKTNCFEDRKFSLTKFSTKGGSGFKNRLSLFKNLSTSKKKGRNVLTVYQRLLGERGMFDGKGKTGKRSQEKEGIVFRSLEKLKKKNRSKEPCFRPLSYSKKTKLRKIGKRRNAKKNILKIMSNDFKFKDETKKARRSNGVRKSLKKRNVGGRKFKRRDVDFERALEKNSMKKKISIFETLIERKSVTPRKMRLR